VSDSRLALVESPAQLLNVIELDRVEPQSEPTRIAVLAPVSEPTRTQLRAMTSLARQQGHPVSWYDPRLGGASVARSVRAMAADLRGVDRLVVGDPFSGVIGVIISISRPREVTIVDDGTATLEFARQWAAGEPLTRWHDKLAGPGTKPTGSPLGSLVRGQVADQLRRRLAPQSCRLRLFTVMPVDLPGVEVVPNSYGWVRQRHEPPVIKTGADLVGTSLVESGVLDEEAYLDTVAELARTHRVDRYFAHRKENDRKLARIHQLGLQVMQPLLPLELIARRGPIGRRILSFPSTVVYSLPVVLAGSASEVVVCTLSQGWYGPSAPPRADAFLSSVTNQARRQHGLAAVAC
jgi:hypothetical protein